MAHERVSFETTVEFFQLMESRRRALGKTRSQYIRDLIQYDLDQPGIRTRTEPVERRQYTRHGTYAEQTVERPDDSWIESLVEPGVPEVTTVTEEVETEDLTKPTLGTVKLGDVPQFSRQAIEEEQADWQRRVGKPMGPPEE